MALHCSRCTKQLTSGQRCKLAPINRWLCPLPVDRYGTITTITTSTTNTNTPPQPKA